MSRQLLSTSFYPGIHGEEEFGGQKHPRRGKHKLQFSKPKTRTFNKDKDRLEHRKGYINSGFIGSSESLKDASFIDAHINKQPHTISIEEGQALTTELNALRQENDILKRENNTLTETITFQKCVANDVRAKNANEKKRMTSKLVRQEKRLKRLTSANEWLKKQHSHKHTPSLGEKHLRLKNRKLATTKARQSMEIGELKRENTDLRKEKPHWRLVKEQQKMAGRLQKLVATNARRNRKMTKLKAENKSLRKEKRVTHFHIQNVGKPSLVFGSSMNTYNISTHDYRQDSTSNSSPSSSMSCKSSEESLNRDMSEESADVNMMEDLKTACYAHAVTELRDRDSTMLKQVYGTENEAGQSLNLHQDSSFGRIPMEHEMTNEKANVSSGRHRPEVGRHRPEVKLTIGIVFKGIIDLQKNTAADYPKSFLDTVNAIFEYCGCNLQTVLTRLGSPMDLPVHVQYTRNECMKETAYAILLWLTEQTGDTGPHITLYKLITQNPD